MPEITPELTPEQQAAALAQQAASPPVVTPPVAPVVAVPDPDTDWEKRYKGSVKMVEQLTIANRDHASQQQLQTSEIERLKADLANKDIERTVAVSERDTNLETALTASAAKDTELAKLRAHKLKVDLAKELGHPELISILDRIPDMEDHEVQKTVMMDFVQFREAGIQEREKALLSGTTPPVSPVISTPATPTTTEGWAAYVEDLPLGSKERTKASDEWFEWTRQQK